MNEENPYEETIRIAKITAEQASAAREREAQQGETARLALCAGVKAAMSAIIIPELEKARQALDSSSHRAELGNGTTPHTGNPRRSLIIDTQDKTLKLSFEARLEWDAPAITWSAPLGKSGTLVADFSATDVQTVIRDFLSQSLK